MKPYQHVLIALDLSDYSEQLMKRAMELCETLGGSVSVVHVVEPIPAYSFGYLGVEDLEEQVSKHATESVKRFAKTHHLADSQCHVMHGSTKHEIGKFIEEQKVDLLMVGSHSRHGVQVLLGSTANALMHVATCDVLSVRLSEE